MGSLDNELGSLAKYIVSKGPNWLYFKPKRGEAVSGLDEDGVRRSYCYPEVELARTADISNDYDIVFTKDYKNSKLKLCCTFKVNPTVKEGNAVAMRLFNPHVTLNMGLEDKPTSLPLKASVSSDAPQILTATALMTLQEFEFLTECFENGNVSFNWSGEIRWYDVSHSEVLDILRGQKMGEKQTLTSTMDGVSGTTDTILIKKENETTYGAVLGTLDWEYEEFGKHVVWFKDMMTRNAYYLLPQVYWIKANAKDNKPSVLATFSSLGVEEDDVDASKLPIRYQITVAPYYHPGALRNMYELVTRRSKGSVRYCRLAAGGYSGVEFRWDPDFLNSYGEVGIKADVEGNADAKPGSSFNLVFQVNTESFEHFHDLIKTGTKVGTVVFDNHIEVDVILDAHRLAQLQLDVRTLMPADRRYRFSYQSTVQNPGKMGLRMEGCEMTSLSRDKNGVVKDSRYGMKNTGSFYLNPGESRMVDLAPDEIHALAGKSSVLGVIPYRHWAELVCQPCDIYLDEEDVNKFFSQKFFGVSSRNYKYWKVEVGLNLSPSVLEKIDQVEVEIRTVEKTLPVVVLDKEKKTEKVTMSKSIQYTLFTELRNYIYHYRVASPTGKSEWSEWKAGPTWDPESSDHDYLTLYDIDMNNLIPESL